MTTDQESNDQRLILLTLYDLSIGYCIEKEHTLSMKTTQAQSSKSGAIKKRGEPIVLKTWEEADRYFEEHLKPVRHRNGRAVYALEDIKKLNVRLPS